MQCQLLGVVQMAQLVAVGGLSRTVRDGSGDPSNPIARGEQAYFGEVGVLGRITQRTLAAYS
jgi:hypothetical protein